MRVSNFKNAAVAGVVLTLCAMIFLVSGSAQTEGTPQPDAIKYTDAATYYKSAKCLVCHGPKAEKKFDTTLKDEDLVNIVLKGKKPEKPPNMPSYEAKCITAAQAKELVDYMKSLKQ